MPPGAKDTFTAPTEPPTTEPQTPRTRHTLSYARSRALTRSQYRKRKGIGRGVRA